MSTLGKTAIVAIVLLLGISIPASAGSGSNSGSTNWGAVAGAGILGGIVGGALAPAPQQQIIVVPAQPAPSANVIVVVPPGYQAPSQAQVQAQKWQGALAAHCIGGSFVDGLLTVNNTCQRPVA